MRGVRYKEVPHKHGHLTENLVRLPALISADHLYKGRRDLQQGNASDANDEPPPTRTQVNGWDRRGFSPCFRMSCMHFFVEDLLATWVHVCKYYPTCYLLTATTQACHPQNAADFLGPMPGT